MKFKSGFISNSSSSSYVVVGWKKDHPHDCIKALAEAHLDKASQQEVADALEEGDLCYATHLIGRGANMDKFDAIYLDGENKYLIGAVIPIPEHDMQELSDTEIEKVISKMLQVLVWDAPKVYSGTIYG